MLNRRDILKGLAALPAAIGLRPRSAECRPLGADFLLHQPAAESTYPGFQLLKDDRLATFTFRNVRPAKPALRIVLPCMAELSSMHFDAAGDAEFRLILPHRGSSGLFMRSRLHAGTTFYYVRPLGCEIMGTEFRLLLSGEGPVDGFLGFVCRGNRGEARADVPEAYWGQRSGDRVLLGRA